MVKNAIKGLYLLNFEIMKFSINVVRLLAIKAANMVAM